MLLANAEITRDARFVFDANREILVLDVLADPVRASSILRSESRAELELHAGMNVAHHQRPHSSFADEIRLMGAALHMSERIHFGLVPVLHLLFDADDQRLGILESLQLQHPLLFDRAAPVLILPLRG